MKSLKEKYECVEFPDDIYEDIKWYRERDLRKASDNFISDIKKENKIAVIGKNRILFLFKKNFGDWEEDE